MLVIGYLSLCGVNFSGFSSSSVRTEQSELIKSRLSYLGFQPNGVAKKCLKSEKQIGNFFEKVKKLEMGKNDINLLDFIFKKSPYLLKIRNAMGWTLLHDAAHEGNLDLCKKLILFGADIYATTEAVGDTPLHLAVRVHAWKVIKCLYFSNDCEERKNELGAYPFDHECPCCPQEYLDLAKKSKELE